MFAKKDRFYIRDGALVAEFNTTIEPIVWRFDLTKVHATAFRVKELEGRWHLGVEGPKGEFSPVATYASRDLAAVALTRLAAGFRVQTQIAKGVKVLFWVIVVMATLFLADRFLGRLLFSGTPMQPNIAIGQPQSADQALRPPGQ